ncbi:MAG: exopolysaccharide biosynthesis polyprenyl glycosylphosphotransferase [Mangrovicoccus sp.]|nr:exopolysaccharide biosynthesis polyprenyl glycosylphosphotransferase [Mangrovicoccus sp.]
MPDPFADPDTLNMSPAASSLAGQFQRARLSREGIIFAIAMLDWGVFALMAWFGAYGLTPAEFAPLETAGFALLTGTAMVAALYLLRVYRFDLLQKPLALLPRLLIGAGMILALALAFHPGVQAPPMILALTVMGLCLLPAALHCAVIAPAVNWITGTGLTDRRAVLLGGGAPARELIEGLRRNRENTLRICAIFDDRGGERSPDMVLDVPKIGRFDDLLGFARNAQVDMVIIALPIEATDRIAFLMERFKVLPLPVHLAQYSKDYAFNDTVLAPGQARLSLLEQGSFGMKRRVLKRLFDMSFASLALLLLAPLFALIALAIRLDSPGPVFFRQLRSGFNERPISVLKFRSMHLANCDPTAKKIVTKGDPRVTRIGGFLRRSSLDELPQLINVLRGDLSLVGPRPHAIDARTGEKEAFCDLVADYSARHRLPPGITGWAQIHGLRGGIQDPEALRRRVAHDLWYIENWSTWLDLRILLATPIALFDTRNAY